jgi:hypothetical protein
MKPATTGTLIAAAPAVNSGRLALVGAAPVGATNTAVVFIGTTPSGLGVGVTTMVGYVGATYTLGAMTTAVVLGVVVLVLVVFVLVVLVLVLELELVLVLVLVVLEEEGAGATGWAICPPQVVTWKVENSTRRYVSM